ncbi:MAG: hypothetical protein KBE09_05285 [Candidatus Pacebacteria bacterium]|nr:hypothetical protein [Candidatus Paceibacterota bacterium]
MPCRATIFGTLILLLCSSTVYAQEARKKQQPRSEEPFIVTYVSFCNNEAVAKELAEDIALMLTQTQPREPQELRSHLEAMATSHDCISPPSFTGAFFHWDKHREDTRIVQLPGYRAGVRSLSRTVVEGLRSTHRHMAVVAVPLEVALLSERNRGARQMLEYFKHRGLGSFIGPRRSRPKLDI